MEFETSSLNRSDKRNSVVERGVKFIALWVFILVGVVVGILSIVRGVGMRNKMLAACHVPLLIFDRSFIYMKYSDLNFSFNVVQNPIYVAMITLNVSILVILFNVNELDDDIGEFLRLVSETLFLLFFFNVRNEVMEKFEPPRFKKQLIGTTTSLKKIF
jgi:hypothetical protein